VTINRHKPIEKVVHRITRLGFDEFGVVSYLNDCARFVSPCILIKFTSAKNSTNTRQFLLREKHESIITDTYLVFSATILGYGSITEDIQEMSLLR
jgi:hypothetical protein